MLKRDYQGQICSIARSLELISDRWTLLIVRDLVLGLSRFDEILENLGIASNVLTDRLGRLVDEEIAERVQYNERPERFEYRLTPKGRELGIVLLALMQWGDRHISTKPPLVAARIVTRPRFSPTLEVSTRPWPLRSSGTRPSPARITARTAPGPGRSPATTTSPES